MCLYGNLAHPLHVYLQGPFVNPPPELLTYNRAMSQSHIAVEWVFADISNFFNFLDFQSNFKIGLSTVWKMFTYCALMLKFAYMDLQLFEKNFRLETAIISNKVMDVIIAFL